MESQNLILVKFKHLIEKIVGCNGTGRQELSKIVKEGSITEEEAEMIYAYACIEKINGNIVSIGNNLEKLV